MVERASHSGETGQQATNPLIFLSSSESSMDTLFSVSHCMSVFFI